MVEYGYGQFKLDTGMDGQAVKDRRKHWKRSKTVENS